MIISISGKSQSGKDTLGKCIQYYFYENKENLSLEDFIKKDIKSNWRIKKFSYSLKKIVSEIVGCKTSDLEKQEFKNKNLKKKLRCKSVNTNRELLQYVGTKLRKFNKRIFVDILMRDYNPETDNWIITDTRFKNEIEEIKKYDCLTIHINRPNNVEKYHKHRSEIDLDKYNNYDTSVNNYFSTKKELYLLIKKILDEHLKIKNEQKSK
jgi:hypothetical protein